MGDAKSNDGVLHHPVVIVSKALPCESMNSTASVFYKIGFIIFNIILYLHNPFSHNFQCEWIHQPDAYLFI